MSDDGELGKLNIAAFSDEKFTAQTGEADVLINPSEYKHGHVVNYTTENQASGSAGETIKFVNVASETLSFKLVFDATGVLSATNPCSDVNDRINKLKAVIYNYNGKIHSPNYLQISWGPMLFKCRLTSMDVEYTLFKPDGSPLRAKMDLGFKGFIDPVTRGLAQQKQSADLTHLRQVVAGDTLPLLCYRVYGSSAYYIEVAKYNQLISFRDIKPGDILVFPPLSNS